MPRFKKIPLNEVEEIGYVNLNITIEFMENVKSHIREIEKLITKYATYCSTVRKMERSKHIGLMKTKGCPPIDKTGNYFNVKKLKRFQEFSRKEQQEIMNNHEKGNKYLKEAFGVLPLSMPLKSKWENQESERRLQEDNEAIKNIF